MTLAVKYERLLRSKVTSPSPDFNQLYALVIDDWHQQHRKKRRKKTERKETCTIYIHTFYFTPSFLCVFIYTSANGSPYRRTRIGEICVGSALWLRLFRSLWIPSGNPRCSVGKSYSGCGHPLSGDAPFNSFRRISENPSSRIYEGIFDSTFGYMYGPMGDRLSVEGPQIIGNGKITKWIRTDT